MTDNEKRRAVRKLVDKLACNKALKSFTADYISKQLNINWADVTRYLYELTQDDSILKLKYRFICPECGYVEDYNSFSDMPEEDILDCPRCDKTIYELRLNVYTLYYFDEDYKEKRIKAYKKQKPSPYKDYINFLYTKEDKKIYAKN